MTTCSKCSMVPDYYSADKSSIKNTGMCIKCAMDEIQTTIYNNGAKDIMSGFDENIEYDGENLKVKGYTYFCYDIDSQMYIPDVDELIASLKEKGLYEKYKKQAMEEYEDDDDYHVACISDKNDYMGYANGIKEALKDFEEISVEINNDDDMIFVDIEVNIVMRNSNPLGTFDSLMDSIKDAICAAKYH